MIPGPGNFSGSRDKGNRAVAGARSWAGCSVWKTVLFSGFIQGHVGDQPGKEGPAPVLSLHGGGGSRGAGEQSSDGHYLLSSGCCPSRPASLGVSV